MAARSRQVTHTSDGCKVVTGKPVLHLKGATATLLQPWFGGGQEYGRGGVSGRRVGGGGESYLSIARASSFSEKPKSSYLPEIS